MANFMLCKVVSRYKSQQVDLFVNAIDFKALVCVF